MYLPAMVQSTRPSSRALKRSSYQAGRRETNQHYALESALGKYVGRGGGGRSAPPVVHALHGYALRPISLHDLEDDNIPGLYYLPDKPGQAS